MRTLLAGIVAVAGLAFVPAAHGATVVGQVAASPLSDPAGSYDMAQAQSAAPGFRLPGGRGVIVEWRTNVIDTSSVAQLRVYQDSAGGFNLVGESEFVEPKTAGVRAFPVRIGIVGGEVLGLFLQGTGFRGAGGDADVACSMAASAEVANGTFRTSQACTAGQRLNVEVTWEPDADRDEWGDETQDRCPGVRGVADGCEGGSNTGSPEDELFAPGGPRDGNCSGSLGGGRYQDITAIDLSCTSAKRVINRWRKVKKRTGTKRVRPDWRCTRTVLEGRRYARINCKRRGEVRIRFYERLRSR
jgi:hypothetical protein